MDPIVLLIVFAASIAVFIGLTMYNVLRGVRVTREALVWYFVVLILTALIGVVVGIIVGTSGIF